MGVTGFVTSSASSRCFNLYKNPIFGLNFLPKMEGTSLPFEE